MTSFAPSARGFSRVSTGLALAVFGGLFVSACADREANQVLVPSVVGMTTQTPAFYSDGQVTLYQVTTPVRLTLRRYSDEEGKALRPAPPLPRMPFVESKDVEITVRFTLVNLDDVPRTIELLVDPWNEFVRYRPMINRVSNEETTPDFSGFDKYFVLGPKERFEGVITPDDTKELAVDLATAQVLVARPPPAETGGANGLINRAFNLQNRSSAPDPLLGPTIDSLPAIPAMTGFDLGLRTTEPANVAVEVIVDLRDFHGERIVPPGDDTRTFGPPGTILSPPPPTR